MSTATYQDSLACGLQPQPSTADAGALTRRERKTQAARAAHVRKIKQLIMGSAFIVFLAAGWFYPLIGYFIPLCMLLGIGIAAFQGRSWCNWLCPRGSFADSLLSRVSRHGRIPQALRSTPMRLGVMGLLMTVLTVQLIRLWPDPWAIGGFFVILLTITTGAGVILGVIFQQRSWCYLCPIGTMSNWVGQNRQPLHLKQSDCLDCGLCAKKCPMQLTPVGLREPGGMNQRGDCLKCSVCVDNCPTAALSWTTAAGK